ncbi:hypothetical protein TNCV_414051 [Trichonephila clavipes]|nr:hypothetical protein TNCV_414051 [Trichonephila clavipes]
MVREATGGPNEDATCAWMAVEAAVGCMRAFLAMGRSYPRQLVIEGRSEPDLHLNAISWIHWSQHLLTTQLE